MNCEAKDTAQNDGRGRVLVLWRKICSIGTLLVLVGLFLMNVFGSPVTRYMMERDVTNLLMEHGYREEELLKVESVYRKDEQKKYTVRVIFQDKPETVYYYYYDINHVLQVKKDY